ncbi:MAG: hypothetical protein ACK424_08350, partial [Candidatus Thermochlorobacter sp.]
MSRLLTPALDTPSHITIGSDTFELYLSESVIAERVEQLGKQIEQDYAGKSPIFIGVLNGAFIFMADLVRAVQTIDLE